RGAEGFEPVRLPPWHDVHRPAPGRPERPGRGQAAATGARSSGPATECPRPEFLQPGAAAPATGGALQRAGQRGENQGCVLTDVVPWNSTVPVHRPMTADAAVDPTDARLRNVRVDPLAEALAEASRVQHGVGRLVNLAVV